MVNDAVFPIESVTVYVRNKVVHSRIDFFAPDFAGTAHVRLQFADVGTLILQ